MKYIWHSAKAEEVLKTRGIDFLEAVSVCEDPLANVAPHIHDGEMQLRITGHSLKSRLLTVVTVELDGDEMRIVTAWRATKTEREAYEGKSK